MTFEEYKKAFEEVLALSEKIEILCKKNKFDEIDEPFNKRNQIFASLSLPEEELTEEQVQSILNLRDKILEKNEFIKKAMQVRKNVIKQELSAIKQETKIVETYKIPKGDINSSIFDSRE